MSRAAAPLVSVLLGTCTQKSCWILRPFVGQILNPASWMQWGSHQGWCEMPGNLLGPHVGCQWLGSPLRSHVGCWAFSQCVDSCVLSVSEGSPAPVKSPGHRGRHVKQPGVGRIPGPLSAMRLAVVASRAKLAAHCSAKPVPLSSHPAHLEKEVHSWRVLASYFLNSNCIANLQSLKQYDPNVKPHT